jgi:hypothetical protein
MTLSINGNTIGTIRRGMTQSGGMVTEEPGSPGNTLIQPYKTGVTPKKFSFQVTVNSTSYHDIIETIDGLCEDEPCVYLSDDVATLYNDVQAGWALINAWKAELIYAGGTARYGIITFECMATTDSTGSSYTPPE